MARVSDGDTVRLRFPDGHEERTRLIGIDAGETHSGVKLERMGKLGITHFILVPAAKDNAALIATIGREVLPRLAS